MPEPMVFDQEEALKRVDNDRELYGELVSIFFEEYPGYLATLKEGLASGDGQKVREVAHSMKSALGNIGAMKCYTLAQVIEMNGKQNHLDVVGSNIKTLEDEVAKYKAVIDVFLKG